MRRSVRQIAAIVAMATGALGSCAVNPTYVLVVVSTDLRAPRVTLTAHTERSVMSTDPRAPSEWADRFTLVRPLVHESDGLADVGIFSVLPRRGRADEPVWLDLTISDGATVLRRRSLVRFVAGSGQSFRVVLRAQCLTLTTGCTTVPVAECTVSQRCEERMQTCGDDAQCVSTMVDTTPVTEPPSRPDSAVCPDPSQCVARECQVPVARCEMGRTVCSSSDDFAGTPCSLGVCDGAGRCVACGSAGELCCGESCRAGLTCAAGRCEACGGRNQRCCGVACLGGLDCASGRCESCGASGERCCAGVFCNPGASCAMNAICR
jgi:hypothetical protein